MRVGRHLALMAMLVGWVVGCSAAPAVAPREPASTPAAPPAPAPEMAAMPDPAQRAAAKRIDEDARRLMELGSRDAEHPLVLADATDWLFLKLEGLGFAVRRVGFATEDSAAQNLEILLDGADAQRPRLALTVPFDSPMGGTDWRAAMAAALQIALADRVKERPRRSTAALIWLSYTHEPAIVAERSGSFAHAKQARINDERYSAVVNLRFIDAPANAVRIEGTRRAAELVERLGGFFQREADLKVTTDIVERVSGDALAFDRVEYPAVELSLGYPASATNPDQPIDEGQSALRWLELMDRLLDGLDELIPANNP